MNKIESDLLSKHYNKKLLLDDLKKEELDLRNRICVEIFSKPENIFYQGSESQDLGNNWKVTASFKYSVEVIDERNIDSAYAEIFDSEPDLANKLFEPTFVFCEEKFQELDLETKAKIEALCFTRTTKINKVIYEKLSDESKFALSDFVKLKRSQPTLSYKQSKKK